MVILNGFQFISGPYSKCNAGINLKKNPLQFGIMVSEEIFLPDMFSLGLEFYSPGMCRM